MKIIGIKEWDEMFAKIRGMFHRPPVLICFKDNVWIELNHSRTKILRHGKDIKKDLPQLREYGQHYQAHCVVPSEEMCAFQNAIEMLTHVQEHSVGVDVPPGTPKSKVKEELTRVAERVQRRCVNDDTLN